MPPAADLPNRAALHGCVSQSFNRRENSSKRARNTVPVSVVKAFACSSICPCARESKLTMRRYQSTRRLSTRADQLLSWSRWAPAAVFCAAVAAAPGVGSIRSHAPFPS